MNLDGWGWNNHFEMYFAAYAAKGCLAGRVLSASRERYSVMTEQGPYMAGLSGKMRNHAENRSDLPAVGDWVALSLAAQGPASITGILPRLSKFSRKVAGDVVEEQVIAANIDTAFLLCSLNRDFNLRRLERYLALVRESGARPVVVLTKSDLCERPDQKLAEARSTAAGAPVHAVSSLSGAGLDELKAYLVPGSTAVLLGSSGAGKSTLLNRLAGLELQRVQEVRSGDDRGRHTTTQSQIVVLPGGAMVIDTPGLRELQLWGSGEGISETFEDLEELAARCRFSDCSHRSEPGCAIQEALKAGHLHVERFNSYLKLQREMAYLERARDQRARVTEQAKWKAIHKAMRQHRK